MKSLNLMISGGTLMKIFALSYRVSERGEGAYMSPSNIFTEFFRPSTEYLGLLRPHIAPAIICCGWKMLFGGRNLSMNFGF
jgi:hypothetical protein